MDSLLVETSPPMLHTILPRFIPTTGTILPLPGDGLLLRFAAVLLAVIARLIEPARAFAARFFNDLLFIA